MGQKITLAAMILALFCLAYPRITFASSLNWKLVYQSQRESTSIKISPKNPALVYASVRYAHDFDLLKSFDGGINWVSIKNGLPPGLDVNWISLTSSNAATIAISLWGSGINISEDYGNTWTNIYSSPPSRSVEISPTDPNIIFAGIGGNHDVNSGVYMSSNKGISWTKTSLTNNNAQILIDNSYPNRIFADSDPGYYRSLDGGISWTQLPITYTFSNSVIDDFQTNTIYTSQFDSGNGIYKSTDNGDSWTRKSNIISSAAFRLAQNQDGTLFASRYFSGGGIWRSKDGAESWENVADPAWATASGNTWGLDARNGRILVSVEGLGIYAANADGSPINPLPPLQTHKACVNNACAVVDGADSDSCQAYSDCIPPPPLLPVCSNLIVAPISGEAPLTVSATISGQASGYAEYVFDFGDGHVYWEPTSSLSHTFDSSGDYIVKGYIADGLINLSEDTSSCHASVKALPPGPNPIVVIPGFGGSWSSKAFILRQNTDYRDWEIMPFKAPGVYNPFFDALAADGLQRNQKAFFFAYDFTKPVSQTANWLNDFLANEVMPKNPGKKVDIVAHSMGGLLARTCFERVIGCNFKIDKIITAGTPHKGSIDAYNLWEGADLAKLDFLSKIGTKIILHLKGFPTGNEVKIIQENILGAKDLLPVFDFIYGKYFWNLSPLGQNLFLQSLSLSPDFISRTLALSGNKDNSTVSYLTTTAPNKPEFADGYWIDGKPKILAKNLGDGTVLNSSSRIFGAINKDYKIGHLDYLNTQGPINDILQFLGLPKIISLRSFKHFSSAAIYYSSNPDISINIESAPEENVYQSSSYTVFVLNGKQGKRQLTISAKKSGNSAINAWYIDDLGNDIEGKPMNVKLNGGEKKNIEFKFD